MITKQAFSNVHSLSDPDQGAAVEVQVRQDAGQLHFAADPPGRRPRHAFLPRWHFDMLADGQRNAAYQVP